MQNFIADKLTQSLSEKLHTEVSVGDVDYKLFNTFQFNRLYVEDLHQDTLLYVDKAYADFDLWKIFKKKLIFKEVKLDGLRGNLTIDTAGVSNLDFLIKALVKPRKDTVSNPLEFNFSNIRIVNSQFALNNLRKPGRKDSSVFDANRLLFRDINTKISVSYFRADSLATTIHSFSAVEKSGLRIDNLSTSLTGLKTGFRFSELKIKLPNSSIVLDSVRMEYDSIACMRDIMNKVKWTAKIKPSEIALNDLSAFVPNFSRINSPISVSGKLNGRISSFRLKELDIHYRNSIALKADIDLNGVAKLDETFLYANIKDFRVNKGEAQDLIARIMGKPFVLPKELARLGTVKYNGNVSGFFSNLVSYGTITTDAGVVKTDILLKLENKMQDLRYNGTIQSNSFQLGNLLANKTLGKTAFKITTDGAKRAKKSFQGSIRGDVPLIFLNKYTYQNIKLDGEYDGTGFEGDLTINDPNLNANFSGVIDMTRKLPLFNFDLKVDNADLNAIRLINKYESSTLRFKGNANLVGNSLDNLNGFLLLDSIQFVNKDKELTMELLLLESEMGEKSRFTITSDLLTAKFDGKFKYSTIAQSVASLVQKYLPSLSGENVIKSKKKLANNNLINIDLKINDTKRLVDLLELPLALEGTTLINGVIDDENDSLRLEAMTPFFVFGKQKIENLRLKLDNHNKQLNLAAIGRYNMPKDVVDLRVQLSALSDSLYTQVAWHNNDSVNFSGELQALTKVKKENNLTSAVVSVRPTQIMLFDSIWDVKASTIVLNPDTTIDVQKFRLENKNQYVLLDGVASKNMDDVLNVEIDNIDVGFVLDLLHLTSVSIKGKASGIVGVSGLLKKPVLESNLYVKNAELNNTPIGNASIYSGWSPGDSELLVSGAFLEGKDTIALAGGSYSFASDSVNFVFDANKLEIGFLSRWLGEIAQNIKGKATGSVRMFGPTKKIGFEGKVFADEASATIDFLKTTYSFSDTVYLQRRSIALKNVKIRDAENNTGTLTGVFSHNGNFKDINYDFKIKAKNMLALNTKSTDNDIFYGKAYASGDVHLHGTDIATNIDVDVKSQPKTKVYISVGGAAVANENDFINFVQKDTVVIAKTLPSKTVRTTPLNLSMNLDVTPDAEIQLIISPQAGDMIAANGTGSLRMLMNGDEDMKMYGGFTIEKGNYLFTLENLIRKQFKIEEGGTITWSGDPMRAQLDIRAIHSLTASLYDLMSEDILKTTDRTSVPVNATLHLTDEMMTPNIRFDVDLPSSDETLKMQVRNLINTEEMMNRQMVYLLLFGKFYTPEYNRSSPDLANSTFNNFSSLASSAALGQVNNYLSQLITNLSFGLNVRSTGYGEQAAQEYETAIKYQPNNRLIVNGNFGYRNDEFARNKIIGDVDIEYLLTQNSKWRLKAFNHTVDRYSLKSAPFIQGLGIMYKEDFNSWSDLMYRFRQIGKTSKTENENPMEERITETGKSDSIIKQDNEK